MDLLETLDWVLAIVGDRCVTRLVTRSCKLLYFACNNGSFEVIERTVRLIERYGLLHKELEGMYETWNEEKVTLVLFLCHMNMNDMRPIRLLREKGFPVRLLRCRFEGRNALEKALFYDNVEMVRELLKVDTWARTFIQTEEKFNELTRSLQPDSDAYQILQTRFNTLQLLEKNISMQGP